MYWYPSSATTVHHLPFPKRRHTQLHNQHPTNLWIPGSPSCRIGEQHELGQTHPALLEEPGAGTSAPEPTDGQREIVVT